MQFSAARFTILYIALCSLCASCGGGGTDGASASAPPLIVNGAPVADAGRGGNFQANVLIALDCSGSSDPQGDALTYLWQQTDGPMVQLSDDRSCNPTFVAPDATVTITFRLQVSDTLSESVDAVSYRISGSEALPPVTFTEVGAAAGFSPYVMAIGPHAGIAVEDIDGNGFLDIFVPNGEGNADQIYVNRGDGTFQDISASVGLDSMQNHRSALWVDYDGDHDLDLVIGGDCRDDPVSLDVCNDPQNLWLYRQDPSGSFEDVSDAAGLSVAWGGRADWHRGGISAGDINNDGYLDLVVVGWHDRAYLFLNNSDGTFTDIAVSSNVSEDVFAYQQAVFHDFDRDGWIDLYFAIDGQVSNRLYINQRDNTFLDIAESAGVAYASTDMGIALGDVNNDGYVDLYVTEISQFVNDEYVHNQLYVNNASGTTPSFTEISETVGVQNGFWGWGATFIDYDNDGWQDLATTNGKNLAGWTDDHSRLWRNSGITGRAFDDVSAAAHFDDDYIGAGLIAADLDRDGDLDLLQTTSENGPLRFLRNNAESISATANNFVSIKPRMTGTNHWAIGAVVTIEVGANRMTRVITAGTSTDSQEPAEAHFGLELADAVDRVIIDWPGGIQSVHVDLAANQEHLVSFDQ